MRRKKSRSSQQTPDSQPSIKLDHFVTSKFSSNQNELLRVLTERSPVLGNIYLGGLLIYYQSDNPDHLPLAAHSFREIMRDQIPKYLNVPIQERKQGLGGRVGTLAKSWEAALRNSPTLQKIVSGSEPATAIDPQIRSVLRKMGNFFAWKANNQKGRQDEALLLLREIEPSKRTGPVHLEKERVEFWESTLEFFNVVAHHGPCSRVDFIKNLNALEEFLLPRLKPITFSDFKEIDMILAEARNG